MTLIILSEPWEGCQSLLCGNQELGVTMWRRISEMSKGHLNEGLGFSEVNWAAEWEVLSV